MRKDALEPIARRTDVGEDDDDGLGGGGGAFGIADTAGNGDGDGDLEWDKKNKKKEIETLEFSPQDVLEARIYLGLPVRFFFFFFSNLFPGSFLVNWWGKTTFITGQRTLDEDAQLPEDEVFLLFLVRDAV